MAKKKEEMAEQPVVAVDAIAEMQKEIDDLKKRVRELEGKHAPAEHKRPQGKPMYPLI